MKSRCSNPNIPCYSDYGGRGITVCVAWIESFAQFLQDVGPRPSHKHSLDRWPNPNGGYEPGNVRWATKSEQNNNRRNTTAVTFKGRTQTIREWADELGVSWGAIRDRVGAGKPIDKHIGRWGGVIN